MVICEVKCYINWYTGILCVGCCYYFLRHLFILILDLFFLSNRSGKLLFTRRYSLFPNAVGYAPDVVWQLLSVVFAPDPADAVWRWADIPNVAEDLSIFS